MPAARTATPPRRSKKRPPAPAVSQGPSIARLADAVVEGACQVAVLSLPLYFTVLTAGFESDKAVLLRALAAVAAVAWLIGTVLRREGGGIRRSSPLLWLGTLLFAAYIIATLLSIDPRVSLWGSGNRQQGLWTRAAYLVFLVAVATRFRTRRQIDRLITALLWGSVAVVAYGFLQEFGYDPVPSTGSPDTLQWPVWSSFGQHVFLGSYLVIVIPFTAARLLQNRAAAEGLRGPWYRHPAVLRAGVGTIFFPLSYVVFLWAGVRQNALFALLPAFLAGYVLLALVLSRLPDSPQLAAARVLGYALLLGGQVLVLFFSGARASWLGALAALPVFGFAVAWRLEQRRLWRAILVVTVAGGALLLLLNIPNGPLQPLRQVHGLSRIANITDSGGTEGSAQGRILIWQGVKNLLITDPSIGGSWGGPARIVVGYGPESMLWAFQHDFPLALRRANSEINAWDRAHNIYLDYLVDAGAVALLVLLAVLAAFFWRIGRMLPRVDEPAAWILIAVAAAMVGHLVDGFFSLETAVSFLLFWTMVGVVASDGLTREDEAPEPAQASSLELLGWLAVGFVGAALLLTIASATDHPTLLAVFWLLSVMAGAGVVAAGLLGEVKVRFPSALPRRRSLTVCLLALAAGALALGSQMHVETAAFADRIGTNVLNGGQPFAGLEYLEQAAATDPYEPSYQTHLAQAYLSLGQNRTDPAATEATYVPKPGDERTLDPARAVNMGQNQLFQLAAFALESARSLSPLDPDAYENLGVVYRVWGRPQEALAEYRRAQQLTFNSPRYLDDEALAELDAQRPQVAARDARAALNLDTTFWLSHYALAKVDHQLGDHAAAKGEAGLALYWFHNYWPPPPASQIDELKSLQKNG